MTTAVVPFDRTGPDPVVLALTAGPDLDPDQARVLVAAAHAGDAAAALLELGLDAGGGCVAAAARGAAARRRLLTALLPVAVVETWKVAGLTLPTELVRTAVLALVAAVGRFDPASGEDLAAWARAAVRAAVRAESEAAAPPEDGESRGAGLAWLVQVRAALVGDPIGEVEAAVLALRFGDGDQPPLSLAETGRRLDLSRHQVRATEARVMATIRRHPSRIVG